MLDCHHLASEFWVEGFRSEGFGAKEPWREVVGQHTSSGHLRLRSMAWVCEVFVLRVT